MAERMLAALPGGDLVLQGRRVVGRRTQTQDSLVVQPDERADAVAWHRAVGGLGIAKGVYRFRSHEEADAWLWRMMTRPKG